MKNVIVPLFIFPLFLFAQPNNLVLNPGFEEHKPNIQPCTYIRDHLIFNEIMDHWTSFNRLTPDLAYFPDSTRVFRKVCQRLRNEGFVISVFREPVAKLSD